VSLDASIQGFENLQVVSFMGGIDLFKGRYDKERYENNIHFLFTSSKYY